MYNYGMKFIFELKLFISSYFFLSPSVFFSHSSRHANSAHHFSCSRGRLKIEQKKFSIYLNEKMAFKKKKKVVKEIFISLRSRPCSINDHQEGKLYEHHLHFLVATLNKKKSVEKKCFNCF